MIAIDTNVLAYAAFANADARKAIAMQLVVAAAFVDAIIPIQVLIEFANASLRRRQLPVAEVQRRITEWSTVFPVVTSVPEDVIAALVLVENRQLSYFDALIIATSRRAGATTLLTEDMQDGAEIDGLHILNPFAPANRAPVAALLAG